MLDIPLKSKHAFDRNSLEGINKTSSYGILTSQNITKINMPAASKNSTLHNNNAAPVTSHNNNAAPVTPHNSNAAPVSPQTGSSIPGLRIPSLHKPILKGQKVSLFQSGLPERISVNLGWNTTNSQCDADVSAFLLGGNGKVIGDSWFVFYGQTTSPDNSVILSTTAPSDRETISIDFNKLNPNVKKIVFVLTIYEAFEKNLNFGMVKDAYIRLLTSSNQSELVSFKMTEYYNNVISMMIGEIYKYNDSWKFNAIGNGVTRDLAGLCDLYGVETI